MGIRYWLIDLDGFVNVLFHVELLKYDVVTREVAAQGTDLSPMKRRQPTRTAKQEAMEEDWVAVSGSGCATSFIF